MVELRYETIEGARGERTIAFLHGILGSGNNLRTIARKFVAARPSFTAWLVDLRGHGRSPKGTPNPSLAAAAEDVRDLAENAPLPLGALVGHSFGGKTALLAAAGLPSVEHVVTIDSTPSSREPPSDADSPLAVVANLESLPSVFPSRAAFVDALVAAGQSAALAQWLAMSLEPFGEGVRFALHLDEVRALLFDYFASDQWPLVETPPNQARVHLVIGDRSTAFSSADRERALALASRNPRVTVDVLPAGHWVHVDDPEGLLGVLLARVGGPPIRVSP